MILSTPPSPARIPLEPCLATGQPSELSQFQLLQSRGTSTALLHADGYYMLLSTQWGEGQQEEDAQGPAGGRGKEEKSHTPYLSSSRPRVLVTTCIIYHVGV